MKISSFHISHNGCEPLEYEHNSVQRELNALGLINTALEEADIVIFLSCTFTNFKEDESDSLIKKQLMLVGKKHVIVGGCFLSRNQEDTRIKYVRTRELVNYIRDHYEIIASEDKLDVVAGSEKIIQISEGCTGHCTYCSIRFVRGKLKSRTVDDIITEISLMQSPGRIKLVGQDVAAYGLDLGLNLRMLTEAIWLAFPEREIELGSLNVNILKTWSREELKILADNKIRGNIHIPLQSASDRILDQMGRENTLADFLRVFHILKDFGVKHISTDLIAGFPGESEEDHRDNLELLRSIYFSFIQIFMFEPKKKTKAADMKQLSLELKKERTADLISEYIVKYMKTNYISHGDVIHNKVNIPFNSNLKLESDEN